MKMYILLEQTSDLLKMNTDRSAIEVGKVIAKDPKDAIKLLKEEYEMQHV